MKLFDLLQVPAKQGPFLVIQKQAAEMIIQICRALQISLPAMHAALWVFHCNSLIMGFRNFDRYLYACGAVLVGSKLMQCIRYPTQIFKICRASLRRKKNLQADEDTEEYLKKQVRRVFEAEVNILVNIGFDFDIKLALEEAERLRIFQYSPIDNFIVKYRQTLTSLYSTQVVVLFSSQIIAYLGLRILLKAQNRNIDVIDLDQNIKAKLTSQQVKNAEKEYLQRCIFF